MSIYPFQTVYHIVIRNKTILLTSVILFQTVYQIVKRDKTSLLTFAILLQTAYHIVIINKTILLTFAILLQTVYHIVIINKTILLTFAILLQTVYHIVIINKTILLTFVILFTDILAFLALCEIGKSFTMLYHIWLQIKCFKTIVIDTWYTFDFAAIWRNIMIAYHSHDWLIVWCLRPFSTWLSGKVFDSQSRGPGFEPHWNLWVFSWECPWARYFRA